MKLPCEGSITNGAATCKTTLHYFDLSELTRATSRLGDIEHLKLIKVLILIFFSVLQDKVNRLDIHRRGEKSIKRDIQLSPH